MNNRNINAAGKPETIRTAMEKLKEASDRCRRFHENRSRDDAFQSHISRFANRNRCYTAVNGIMVAIPTC